MRHERENLKLETWNLKLALVVASSWPVPIGGGVVLPQRDSLHPHRDREPAATCRCRGTRNNARPVLPPMGRFCAHKRGHERINLPL